MTIIEKVIYLDNNATTQIDKTESDKLEHELLKFEATFVNGKQKIEFSIQAIFVSWP